MQVGDLVEYGPNLGPQWKKKGMGVVLHVGAFIKVVFLDATGATVKDPNWFHPDNLEVISASR